MVRCFWLILGIILIQVEGRFISPNNPLPQFSFGKEASLQNANGTLRPLETGHSVPASLKNILARTRPEYGDQSALNFRDKTTAKWSNFSFSGFEYGSAYNPKETQPDRVLGDVNTSSQLSSGLPSDQGDEKPMSSPNVSGDVEEPNNSKESNSTGLHCSFFYSLSAIVDLTYDTHVQLIYRGVPSSMVKHFYDRSLSYLLQSKCLCGGHRFKISRKCVFTMFLQRDEAWEITLISRRLRDILLKDGRRDPHVQKFPVYHRLAGTRLPKLTVAEKSIIHSAEQETLRSAAKSDWGEVEDNYLPQSVFPESAKLFYVGEDLDTRCNFYQNVDSGIPARVYVAYALGLGLHIHFSLVENGRATELIDDACFRAYLIAQCEKRNGKAGVIPYFILENQAKHIGSLLDKHGYLDDPDAPFMEGSSMFPSASNISQVVRVGFHFFKTEIDFLSSMDAHGRPIILDTLGHSIYVKDMRARLSEDISLDTLHVAYNIVGGFKSPNNGFHEVDMTRDEAVRCPDGWKFVQRITPIDDVYEYCCSPQCLSLDHTFMFLSVQRESCCEKCNYYRCAAANDEIHGMNESTDVATKHTSSDGGVSPRTLVTDERNRPATPVNI